MSVTLVPDTLSYLVLLQDEHGLSVLLRRAALCLATTCSPQSLRPPLCLAVTGVAGPRPPAGHRTATARRYCGSG